MWDCRAVRSPGGVLRSFARLFLPIIAGRKHAAFPRLQQIIPRAPPRRRAAVGFDRDPLFRRRDEDFRSMGNARGDFADRSRVRQKRFRPESYPSAGRFFVRSLWRTRRAAPHSTDIVSRRVSTHKSSTTAAVGSNGEASHVLAVFTTCRCHFAGCERKSRVMRDASGNKPVLMRSLRAADRIPYDDDTLVS